MHPLKSNVKHPRPRPAAATTTMRGFTAPSPFAFLAAVLLASAFLARPLSAAEDGTEKGLVRGFYKKSCPLAERVVRNIVNKHVTLNPDLPAGLIRLLFHDCFTTGCDASLLLDSNVRGGTVEKNSPANRNTLRGVEVIDEVKAFLEKMCPATVSCADIMAFAAREATILAGGRHYRVPGGRRDSVVSRSSDTRNLPFPNQNASGLIDNFAKKGFTVTEMVVLSGAHSIGGAHCKFFKDRLYNFQGSGEQDPSLDPVHAEVLKARCPRIDSVMSHLDFVSKVPFEFVTSKRLDVAYYTELQKGKGLLTTDQALMEDERTSALVAQMANDPVEWEEKFRRAMMKLGAVDVLVGDAGEVRRECGFVPRSYIVSYIPY